MNDRSSNAQEILAEERRNSAETIQEEFVPVRDINGNIIINPNVSNLSYQLVSADLELQDYNVNELQKVIDFDIYELIPPDDISKFFKDYERLRRKIPGYEADLTSSYATGSNKSHEYLVATSQLYSKEVWIAKPIYIAKYNDWVTASLERDILQDWKDNAEEIYNTATQSYYYNKYSNHLNEDGGINDAYAGMMAPIDTIQPDYFIYKPIYDKAVEVSASYNTSIKNYFDYSKELLNPDGSILRPFQLTDTIQPKFFEIKEEYDAYKERIEPWKDRLDTINKTLFLDTDSVVKKLFNLSMARVYLSDVKRFFANNLINIKTNGNPVGNLVSPSFFDILSTCLINEDIFQGVFDVLYDLNYTPVFYNTQNNTLINIDSSKNGLIQGEPIYDDVQYEDRDGSIYYIREIVGYTGTDPKYTMLINDMTQFVDNCRQILWKVCYMGEETTDKEELNSRDTWIVEYYNVNSNGTYNLNQLNNVKMNIDEMAVSAIDIDVRNRYNWLKGVSDLIYDLISNSMKNNYNNKIHPEIIKVFTFKNNPYTYMIDTRDNIIRKSSPAYVNGQLGVTKKQASDILMNDFVSFLDNMIRFIDGAIDFKNFYYQGNPPDILNNSEIKDINKLSLEMERYQLYHDHIIRINNIIVEKLKMFVNLYKFVEWDKAGNDGQYLNQIKEYVGYINTHVNNIIKDNVIDLNPIYTGNNIYFNVDGHSDLEGSVQGGTLSDGWIINIGNKVNSNEMQNMFAVVQGVIITLLNTDKVWFKGIR